jgi:hypothetical protein
VLGKGQRQNESTDGIEECHPKMAGIKGVIDQPSFLLRRRYAKVPQSYAPQVVCDYGHDGDEPEAVNLRNKCSPRRGDPGEVAQNFHSIENLS